MNRNSFGTIAVAAAIAVLCCFPAWGADASAVTGDGAIAGAGSGAADAAAAAFPDLAGHWAEEAVTALAREGSISGSPDGLFHPDDSVTTAEFVTMLMKGAFGTIAPTGELWSSGYFDEALRQKVVERYDVADGDAPIARRNAARIGLEMLRNVYKEADEPSIDAAMDRLKDIYLCGSCVWSTGQFYVKGIMLGKPGGLFDGDGELTRAEAAIVAAKIADPASRTPPSTDLLPEETANGLITADDALILLDASAEAVLIDAREPDEHSAAFIYDSVCVPLTAMKSAPASEPNPQAALISADGLPEDTNAPIIVYGATKAQSAEARGLLLAAGYKNAYDLGGIDEWPYDIYSTD